MSHEENNEQTKKGVIGWFASNHVAANLLMILLVTAGIVTIFTMKVEVFPQLDIDAITVNVNYRNGSVKPDAVENAINKVVEPKVEGVDGVKKVSSYAFQGRATIIAELDDGADLQKVKDDIQAAVDGITNLPDNIDRPTVTQASDRVQVITIALYGDVSEKTLKELAEDVSDELTALNNISVVEIEGTRNYEISVEISEYQLQKHDLTFDDVVAAIRDNSRDIPAGSIKTEGGEILISGENQRYTGEEFREIPLITRDDGTVLSIGDVATVVDGFEDSDLASRYNGAPAAYLKVFRVGNQGALDLAATVKEYVAAKSVNLPQGVKIDYWFDRSTFLKGRINLLLRNAAIGLCLVFICLCLFLDLRVAFWTTIGIPISFMGAFWLLPLMDVSINMISLFAFIVVLGIVVDDAIVVAENIYEHSTQGKSPYRAAVDGAREMALPVLFAIMTTVVAFLPLLFIDGVMGQILKAIPVVVIAVLLISLVEALIILPAHLNTKKLGHSKGFIPKVQKYLRDKLTWLIMNPYRFILNQSIKWRYATMASAFMLMIVTFTWFAAGYIKTVFFPPMDADNVVAKLEMPQGTSAEQTAAIVQMLEAKGALAVQQIAEENKEALAGRPLMKNMSTTLGDTPFSRLTGGGGGNLGASSGGHLGEVNIELYESTSRGNLPSGEVTKRWRELVGEVPGVTALSFNNKFFSAGDAVNIELAHEDSETLLKAVDDLKQRLTLYAGVTDIDDSFVPGNLEFDTSDLTQQAHAYGITATEINRQLAIGFSGAEAQRVQRGRDDIRVMVRYPEADRRSLQDLDNVRIRVRQDVEVPLKVLVKPKMDRSSSTIQRTAGKRTIAVTADVNDALGNADQINEELFAVVLPKLIQEYPGLTYGIEGEQAERAETFSSLGLNFMIALLLIYILLGIQFKSYFQPLIVMSAIPFGITGAVWGHLIMGIPLSFLSFFGIVALTGVVVNDSLIMIDLINREKREGKFSIAKVLEHSGTRRFRPILLTTLTTFFGLMPMIFEPSIQAKFLIPMAVSLGFGVLFATMITLLLVPALYAILDDMTKLMNRTFNFLLPDSDLIHLDENDPDSSDGQSAADVKGPKPIAT